MVLPIEPQSYPGPDEFDEFWSDPGAFYGRILSYSDTTPDEQPTSVNGMSGAPIFSILRSGDRIDFRLVGIQRSEKKAQRLIRVEPIERVIELFKPFEKVA